VEVVAKNIFSTVGEGPHWEESTGKLLCVDILSGTFHKYHVASKTTESISLGDAATFIIPREKQGYVAGLGREIVALDFDEKKTETLASIEKRGENRFNDAKCDSSGRLWAGSMGGEPEPAIVDRHKGILGCLDISGTWTQHEDGIDISNGMAWSSDGKTFFYIDSIPRKVFAYDYDSDHGTISNKRILYDFEPFPVNEVGVPDGCCIDADDHLWVAMFFGSRIVEIDTKTGTRLRDISLPTQNITSCCWGGESYSDLYVTCGRRGISDEIFLTSQPLAGSLFCIKGLGAKGLPGNIYKG